MPLPALDPAALDSIVTLADSTPLGAKGLMGAAGALSLLAGERLYKAAIVVPGIACGVVLAAALPLDDTSKLIAAVVLAIIGGLIAGFIERLALMAAGTIVGVAATNAVWPLVTSDPTPWWALLSAAVLGLLLFPKIYRAAIIYLTSILGAVMLAWALGRPSDLVVIAGIALFGVLIQTLLRRKKAQKREDND